MSSSPSSTSCMTRVVVQTFVIEPIWKTESGVASTPVAVLEQAGGEVDHLAVLEHRYRGAGHAALGDEAGEIGSEE